MVSKILNIKTACKQYEPDAILAKVIYRLDPICSNCRFCQEQLVYDSEIDHQGTWCIKRKAFID